MKPTWKHDFFNGFDHKGKCSEGGVGGLKVWLVSPMWTPVGLSNEGVLVDLKGSVIAFTNHKTKYINFHTYQV